MLSRASGGRADGERHAQEACGASIVRVDGRRVVPCLTLGIICVGREVTTIEGVADEGTLHPMQQALITRLATLGPRRQRTAPMDEANVGGQAEGTGPGGRRPSASDRG
jgi:xanthine dehydrogenase YagT iron-sulfur-binding subunit